MLTNPTLWVFVASLVATGILTVARVQSMAEERKKDRRDLDRLVRWKQRVNTVLAQHNMTIPLDDDND